MMNLLMFLLGTGTGFTLKLIYDKLNETSNHVDPNNITIGVKNIQPSQVNTNTNLKFYLASINSLFEEYRVNINMVGAFGKLLNQIERQVKLDLLELLSSQNDVNSLLDTFHLKSIDKINIEITKSNNGPFISDSYLSDTIKNTNIPTRSNLPIDDKVKVLLTAAYAKGIDMVVTNFGKDFDKLDSLNKISDPSLQNYFNKIQKDLAFHLKILKR